MNEQQNRPTGFLFSCGALAMTLPAVLLLHRLGLSPLTYLVRHLNGDWGDLGPEDRQWNVQALAHENRIISCYLLAKATATQPADTLPKLWIITESDRSVTTLLSENCQ